jgi:HPt (histidine-containing phosphotransfer) domain-containing protein
MTANAMVADREECLRVGMNDFISKPVNPDQLLMILGKWILPEGSSPDFVEPVVVEPQTSPRLLVAHSSHINLDEVSTLCKNNPDRILKLVSIFFDSGRKGLEEVRQAHAAEDLNSLAEIGHRLKSSSRYIGAHVFADLLHDLEAVAKAGKMGRIASTVDLLEKEWGQLEPELITIIGFDRHLKSLHPRKPDQVAAIST